MGSLESNFWLSVPESGHLAEFCPAEDNNPLFLVKTFIS
jgi:hypothetical protein